MCRRGGGGVEPPPPKGHQHNAYEIHHKSDKTNLLAYPFCRHHPACKDTPHTHPTRCVTPQHACKPAAPPQLIPFLDSFSHVFEWIGRQTSTHVLQSGNQWARGGVCNHKPTRSETKEQNSAHKKILSGPYVAASLGGGGGDKWTIQFYWHTQRKLFDTPQTRNDWNRCLLQHVTRTHLSRALTSPTT